MGQNHSAKYSLPRTPPVAADASSMPSTDLVPPVAADASVMPSTDLVPPVVEAASGMPSTDLVLYINHMSQPSRALTLLARALDLEYTETEIDLLKGEHKNEAYSKILPFGTVPAFKDGDITIVESCAALRYIASKYDTSGKWYPDDFAARIRVDQFLDWHHTTLRKHGVGYFRNLVSYPLLTVNETDSHGAKAEKKKLNQVNNPI
ncbi:unnamed protein product, partial [Meganyctiphanes norvegica]